MRDMSDRTSNLPIALGEADPLPNAAAICKMFFAEHERAYGFHNPDDPVEVVNFRLVAVGRLKQPSIRLAAAGTGKPPEATEWREVWFEADSSVRHTGLRSRALASGDVIHGPAVIEQLDATTLLFPGDKRHGRRPSQPQRGACSVSAAIDPITSKSCPTGCVRSPTRLTSRL